MRTSFRSVLAFVLVVVFAVGIVSPAAAQGPQDMLCGDLSADDCALLNGAQTALYEVSSFSVPNVSFEMSITVPEETMRMQGSGSAVVSLSPDVVASLRDLSTTTAMFDYTPLFSLLGQIDSAWVEQALAESLLSFRVDQFSIEPASYDNPSLSDVQFAWKDGTAYLFLTSPNGAEQWFGEEFSLSPDDREQIDAAMEELRAQMELELGDPDYLQSMDTLNELAGIMDGLSTVVYDHVQTARLADETRDGQTLAVFETTFDINGLLHDPALPGAIIDLLNDPAFVEMMTQDGADYDPGDVTESQIQLLLLMAALSIKDTTYQIHTWVGVENGYLYHGDATFALTLDMGSGGAEMASSEMGMMLNYSLDLADFNAVTTDSVETPAAYASLDDIDDFMMGDSGMITGALEPGVEQSGSFDYMGGRDLYTLDLEAGDAVTLTVNTDSYTTVEVYGPDGFLMDRLDPLFDETLAFEADEAGTYLVQIQDSWQAEYQVQAEVE